CDSLRKGDHLASRQSTAAGESAVPFLSIWAMWINGGIIGIVSVRQALRKIPTLPAPGAGRKRRLFRSFSLGPSLPLGYTTPAGPVRIFCPEGESPMFLLRGSAADLRRGWTRRDCLRIGLGGAFGLLGGQLRADAAADGSFGRA